MNKTAIIVTAETNLDLSYYNKDNFYVVGVERGCLDLIAKGVKIDLAIADFDHVLDGEMELIRSVASEVIQLNVDKDFIDGIAAIDYVKKELGIQMIKFICKPTKRYDMNFSILEIMSRYEDIEIYNEDCYIFKFNEGTNEIDFNRYQDVTYVSLYSLKNNNKVTIKNLKFEVENLNVDIFDTRCFSNAFIPYVNGIVKCTKPLVVILSK